MLPDGKIIKYHNALYNNLQDRIAYLTDINYTLDLIKKVPFSLTEKHSGTENQYVHTLTKNISRCSYIFIIIYAQSTVTEHNCYPKLVIDDIELYIGYRLALPYISGLFVTIAYPYLFSIVTGANYSYPQTAIIKNDINYITISSGTGTTLSNLTTLSYVY